jgi:iron complex outermembrane receptor protein
MMKRLHFRNALRALLFTGLATVASPATSHAQQVIPLDTLHVGVSSRLPKGAQLRAIDVIDRRAIERLPTRSVADAIARALGADVLARSPAQADLALRGSTTEQVLILIDGVPVNDTQTGHFHLDQAVPLDQVERIEVMRGAGSAVYGTSAMGGIVNIVTRGGATPSSARVEGGTFGTLVASGVATALLKDVAPFSFGLERARSDGHRAGTDYDMTIARAMFAATAGDGRLRVDVAHAERDFGASQFYAPFPNAYEETRVLTGGVSYDRAFGRVRIEPRASIRRHNDDFVLKRDTPSFYHNVHKTTDAGGGVVIRVPLAFLATAFGGETFRSTIQSTNLKDHDETRSAVFGEAVVTGSRRFALSAGLRADHSSRYGDFMSPSLAGSVDVGGRLRVRGSAGRAFRAPTWTDRYYSDPANRGDSLLEVERAWSYEGGLDIVPFTGWRADVTGFVRDVENAIDWVKPAGAPASTPWQIVNLQEATFRGVELKLQGPEWLGIEWTVRGTALSFDADSAAGFQSKYALRPLTQTASLEVGVPLPFGVTLGVAGSHRRRTAEEPYHLLDARLSYTWRAWSLFATGTNLGDQPYLDVSAARAAGRALGIGLRWNGAPH